MEVGFDNAERFGCERGASRVVCEGYWTRFGRPCWFDLVELGLGSRGLLDLDPRSFLDPS